MEEVRAVNKPGLPLKYQIIIRSRMKYLHSVVTLWLRVQCFSQMFVDDLRSVTLVSKWQCSDACNCWSLSSHPAVPGVPGRREAGTFIMEFINSLAVFVFALLLFFVLFVCVCVFFFNLNNILNSVFALRAQTDHCESLRFVWLFSGRSSTSGTYQETQRVRGKIFLSTAAAA